MFDSRFGQKKLRQRLGIRSAQVMGWDRGFPSEVMGAFDEVRDVWPQLAGHVPIRKLHVYDATEEGAAEFVAWPGLPGLRELMFGVAWESADVYPLLAACAGLKGLVALEVQGGVLSDSGVVAILDSPHLAGLKTCSLHYGLRANALSQQARDRFEARFGQDLLNDDPIPF